jgi:hypothetical protein
MRTCARSAPHAPRLDIADPQLRAAWQLGTSAVCPYRTE